MFPLHVTRKLYEIDALGEALDTRLAFKMLRELGLDDFGLVLCCLPIGQYQYLSAALPSMASEEVCKRWTGNSPKIVMEQAVSFASLCAERYRTLTGETLYSKRILDFGCGYGRFLRIFSFFTDEVVGVDAWRESIEICLRFGCSMPVFLSEEIPEKLPVSGSFDLLTAFSVFTHLNEVATISSISALRDAASRDSLLAITVRPFEYWEYACSSGSLKLYANIRDDMEFAHKSKGFAHFTHPGRSNYGETSLSIGWLSQVAAGWEVVGVQCFNDFQTVVFLKAI